MIVKVSVFYRLLLFLEIVNVIQFSSLANSGLFPKQDPTDGKSILDKANGYYSLKQYDSAIVWIEDHLSELRDVASDSVVVNLQVELAKNYKRLKNFSAGLINAKAALALANRTSNHTGLLQGLSLKSIGDVYLSKGEFDSALIFLEKAATTSLEGAAWEQAAFCRVGMGTCNFRLGDLNAMDESLTGALAIAEDHLPPDNRVYTILFQLFGVLNYQNGDFDKALEIAKKSVEVIQKQKKIDTAKLVYSYNNVGAIYARKGDQGKAIQYYQLAMGLQTLRKNNSLSLADINNNVGLNYLQSGELTKSTTYLLKSLDLHQTGPEIMLSIQHYNCLNNLAICYLERKLLDSANYYLNRVFTSYEASDIWNALPNHTRGVLLAETGDYSRSELQLKKAVSWYEQQQPVPKYDLAEVYKDLADTYFLMGKYSIALDWIRKAAKMLKIDNSKEGSQLMEEWNKMQSKTTLLRILHLEAKINQQLVNETDIGINPALLAYFDKAILLIDHLRTDFASDYSRLNLSRKVVPIYENALEVALQLFDKSGEVEYFEKAFQIAERNKSLALDDAMRKLSVKRNGFIPDSLLDMEQQLQVDLSFYKRSIAEQVANANDKDDLKLNLWRNKVLYLSNSIDSLEQILASSFPQYYYSKYNKVLITLEDLDQRLLKSSDEVLVEYFFGERNIYILSVGRQHRSFDILPITEMLHNHIDTYQQLVSQPPASESAAADFKNFVEVSHFLYEKLLLPVLPNEDSDNIKKIIIIPDHSLNYLSFESLITNRPPSNKVDYSGQHLDYLVNRLNINYGFSVSTLLGSHQKQPSNQPKQLAGFAPSFGTGAVATNRNCELGQLYSLQCSQQEIKDISKIVNGTLFSESEASKVSFVQNADEYGILHLATHACTDDTDPMMNRIYFADDFITTYELFAMQLNADMAVLSACNTGSGKILKGEGVMSLSRGFAFAGCPSLLTSLWSVDDCATSQIMVEFYKQLADGIAKDEALFNAKRNYLSAQGRTNAHPYYWAGFVHVGNVEPLSFSSNRGLKYLWLLLPVALLLLYFFSKNLKRLVDY